MGHPSRTIGRGYEMKITAYVSSLWASLKRSRPCGTKFVNPLTHALKRLEKPATEIA
jgi:hypothetical protein